MPLDPPTILNTDPAAAQLKTITGWVSRNGHFYGDDERAARYDGSTHSACEYCGSPTTKSCIACESCRDKREREAWEKLPLSDGKHDWLCIYRDDHFFIDADDFLEWCDNEEIDPATVMLVSCQPVYLREVEDDYWNDDLPEDGEPPGDIIDALAVLNAAIRAHKEPIAWVPENRRVVIEGPAK